MKRYTAVEARQRLADVLNEADRGEPVIIERRGRRYRLVLDRPRAQRPTAGPALEILDPAVAAGSWTWALTGKGLAFRPSRRRQRR